MKPKLKTDPVTGIPANNKSFTLDQSTLKRIYDLMVKSRVLEERLIRMYKQSDGYFWIGGPGEEAFNVILGMLLKKGQGLDYDYLHLHYRSAAIMTAMGMEPLDAFRQMKNVASDPFSGGRNFSNHFSRKEWNVVPVSSTIETQYSTAIGTAIGQTKKGCTGITIVNGGDAGTAEGDFASCLVWSARPNAELPILIIASNNEWGISTAANTQRGDRQILERAKAFGIRAKAINGNDVEECYAEISQALNFVRTERKPYFIEARVSRLYGHSSATGCNFISEEIDPLAVYENQLESAKVLSRSEMEALREKYNSEMLILSQQVKQEAMPDGSTIYDHIYLGQKGRYW